MNRKKLLIFDTFLIALILGITGCKKSTTSSFNVSSSSNESTSTNSVSNFSSISLIETINVKIYGDEEISHTFTSISNESIDLPILEKERHEFLGWTTIQYGTEVMLQKGSKLSFTNARSLSNKDNNLSLYPVFEEIKNVIDVYKCNMDDELPEIHINTENGISISDKSLIKPDEHKGKNGEIPAYDYVNASISINHCDDDYVLNNVVGKVKVRGNYTSIYAKKPIRIKFDKKQKMLGLNNDGKLKSWVLLAEWKDSSLLRNAFANHISNSLLKSRGLYCSDFRFVKVYLNDSYNGVYLLVEQQQIDSLRVNIPESKEETDGVDTGYMLELDGYYQNELPIQRFSINYGNYKALTNGFSVVNDINNDAQHDFIKKVTQTIWNVTYDAIKNVHNDNNPYHTMDSEGNYIEDRSIKSAKEAIDRVIDIPSLTDMYLIHEICQDRDIGWSSFYFSIDMSKDGNKKLTFTAPWDFDYALGNSSYSNAQKASLKNQEKMISEGRLIRSGTKYKFSENTSLVDDDFNMSNTTAFYVKNNDNPWLSIFSNETWFMDNVITRFKEALYYKVFDNALKMIKDYSQKYETYFNENFTKWNSAMGLKIDSYQPTVVSYFVNQRQAAEYLTIWLKARINGLEVAFNNFYS